MFLNQFGINYLNLLDDKWRICYNIGYEKANSLIRCCTAQTQGSSGVVSKQHTVQTQNCAIQTIVQS